ncbi:chromodomain-helicase-DNA-binding protein 3 isoform X1 [Amborella trichopoda]|uniref:Uncharacterized protein n=1 Tax=Amborella trichopoda TaxID=13333 RepID=U5D2N4_AMBTC|nr:chromodomain-helicase-DNA-binding protein 3 isoform X1 [Amborella trichopoda]ERN19886.1 hypothetical protein AMTR_s00071p00058700 [Amborella trichopoda]|eukprot:XP_011628632.2 chromodomain-helicase-DNA-binding protein 3 isoform X1 [Amborella trichopoda]
MAPSSSSLPNKVAPGDSILVYWDGDRKWYGAEVVSVRENLDCEVVYEDGESEVLNLGDVKYMMRKWKSSTRERKSRRGGDHGLLSVQEMLFSMEDRIPPSVAFEKDLGWWKQWHDRVSKDVKSMNIRGTMNAALEFALQIKPEILLPWWATNSEDWKMRLRTASTVAEAQLVVRDLQFKAIDWFHARELFTLDITRSGNEANGTQNPDHGDPSDAVGVSCKACPQDGVNGEKKHPKLENNGFLKSCCTAVSAIDVNIEHLPRLSPKRLRNKVVELGAVASPTRRRSIRLQGKLPLTEGPTSPKRIRKADTPESSIASDSTSSSAVAENCSELSEIHDHSDSGCSTDDDPGQFPTRGPLTRLRSLKGHDKSKNNMRRGSRSCVVRASESLDGTAMKTKQSQQPSRGPVTRLRSCKGEDKMNRTVGKINRSCNVRAPKSLDGNAAETCGNDGGAEEVIPTNETTHEFAAGIAFSGSSDGFICYVCQIDGGNDLLLLCDGDRCELSFHTFCLYPPLPVVPEGDWLCPHCVASSSMSLGHRRCAKPLSRLKIQSIVGRKRKLVDPMNNVIHDLYLVKWKGFSHHHDTWVPADWISQVHRLRVQSFLQKRLFMEDGFFLIDERKPEWFKIDRVIACREKSNNNMLDFDDTSQQCQNGAGEYEFLVKWMGLDYCEATWETSCTDELLAQADKLVQRHRIANEICEHHSSGSHLIAFTEQPCYLKGGILHEYQVFGLNWILSNFLDKRSVILADDMGLGKTVQAVSFIYCMKQERLCSDPVLVITPKSVIPHWEKEFRSWAEDLNVIVYQGERQSRKYIREHEFYSSKKGVLFDALVTNYELILQDNTKLRKFRWSAIIVDEGHKLKNIDCKLTTLLKNYDTDFRLLLTGTPLQNTLFELFALLNFLDPREFPDSRTDYSSYASIGLDIEEGVPCDSVANISKVQDLLRKRVLRRVKSDVLREMLPPKKWVRVPCALSKFQRDIYANLLKKNYKTFYKEFNGRRIAMTSLLMDLRKCCNHPYLFPGQESLKSSRDETFHSLVEASGKLQLLEKLLPKFKERGERVLIFSQMTKVLDILEDFLFCLGFTYFRIDGQTSASARHQQIQEFNKPETPVFIFLISTRAGGLGISLPAANRVIIYDPDFNPFVDLQAQSRAHRIGQVRPVVVYQLITLGSVEEKILERAKMKLVIENLVMNRNPKLNVKELHTILLHGARKILSKQSLGSTSITYDEEAIATLLGMNPLADEKCGVDDNGYLGSIMPESFGPTGQNEQMNLPPKANEWEEIIGHPIDDLRSEGLGRGKRQKKAVTYECDEVSDSDEQYSPNTDDDGYDDNEDDDDTSMASDDALVKEITKKNTPQYNENCGI